MKQEDSRRFPQRRNGVSHAEFGAGVVTLGRHSISDGSLVQVKFDDYTDAKLVHCDELTSLPSRSVSPDPATSRNSGWVGGNKYRSRK